MSQAELLTVSPKVKLITFGGGSSDFLAAVERLKTQTLAFQLIDEFKGYTPEDLPIEVRETFRPESFDELRGYGFWRWKSYLVHKELSELALGDVLIYLDAGAEVNPGGRDRFTYYLDFVARNNVLLFSMPYQHRNWTKRDPLLFNGQKYYFRNQISAGFLMFRVTKETRKFAEDWNSRSSMDNGRLLRDEPELLDGAVEHRHDQAILSQLAFEYGFHVSSPDETFFQPWSTGRGFPFLLLRNRTGVSRLKYVLEPKPARGILYLVSPILDSRFALDRMRFYRKRLLIRLGLSRPNRRKRAE